MRWNAYKAGQRKFGICNGLLAPFVIATALCACSPDSPAETSANQAANVVAAAQIAAEQAVKDQLRDPDSAEFDTGDLRFKIVATGMIVCGTVNSKNEFGGYAGKQNWIAIAKWSQDGTVRPQGAMIEGVTSHFWPSWRKVCRNNRDGISETQNNVEAMLTKATASK